MTSDKSSVCAILRSHLKGHEMIPSLHVWYVSILGQNAAEPEAAMQFQGWKPNISVNGCVYMVATVTHGTERRPITRPVLLIVFYYPIRAVKV